MNISWFKEYLSDEWSGWDISTFNKYSLNEKDLFFGWWLTGDVQSSFYSIDQIFEFISKSKNGEVSQFLGNSYDVVFNENRVIISKLDTKEEKHYSIEEFEIALLEWEYKLNQVKE
jgi:hypothetical protein